MQMTRIKAAQFFTRLKYDCYTLAG